MERIHREEHGVRELAPVRQAGHDRMDEDGHRPVGTGERKTGEGCKEREEGGEESTERKEIIKIVMGKITVLFRMKKDAKSFLNSLE